MGAARGPLEPVAEPAAVVVGLGIRGLGAKTYAEDPAANAADAAAAAEVEEDELTPSFSVAAAVIVEAPSDAADSHPFAFSGSRPSSERDGRGADARAETENASNLKDDDPEDG